MLLGVMPATEGFAALADGLSVAPSGAAPAEAKLPAAIMATVGRRFYKLRVSCFVCLNDL
jgi:hypothetical protein